jgi:putative lipoic acid-binding regulatory protein
MDNNMDNNMENNMANIVEIYTTLFTDKNNTIKLSSLGTYDKTNVNAITDEQIDVYEIMPNVMCFMNKCNITHYFLMSTKKIPIAYINICYTKYALKPVLLCRIFLYFNIDNVTHIKSINDLTKKCFDGTFSLEATINNKTDNICTIESGLNNNNQLYTKMIELSKSTDMKNIFSSLIVEVEETMKTQYDTQYNNTMFDMPNIK